MTRLVMRGSSRPTGIRLIGGLVAVAAWLLFGWASGWSYLGGPTGAGALVVAPYIALGVLAILAGWRADPVAARLIYLGGVVGATVVAWAAGPVGIEAGAAANMRASYFAMLIVVAAAISAVIGLLVVWGGYRLGRQVSR